MIGPSTCSGLFLPVYQSTMRKRLFLCDDTLNFRCGICYRYFFAQSAAAVGFIDFVNNSRYSVTTNSL